MLFNYFLLKIHTPKSYKYSHSKSLSLVFSTVIPPFSTWKNAQLGEKVIIQLEENSKKIAQEKQDYIDKLNDAASKLESELEKKQVSYP